MSATQILFIPVVALLVGFLAILALHLIFALIESIPLMPFFVERFGEGMIDIMRMLRLAK